MYMVFGYETDLDKIIKGIMEGTFENVPFHDIGIYICDGACEAGM